MVLLREVGREWYEEDAIMKLGEHDEGALSARLW